MTAKTREQKRKTVCSICYKRIDVQDNGWEYGHNADPVSLADPHAHKSLVKHQRCCSHCNTHIVLPIRIMAANGENTKCAELLRPFSNAKNQSQVIVAHMDLLMKLAGTPYGGLFG